LNIREANRRVSERFAGLPECSKQEFPINADRSDLQSEYCTRFVARARELRCR